MYLVLVIAIIRLELLAHKWGCYWISFVPGLMDGGEDTPLMYEAFLGW